MREPPLVVTRAALLAAGITDDRLRGKRRRGEVVRVLEGIYATADAITAARCDPVLRSRLLVTAADLRLRGGVVATGVTAAHLLDIPLLRPATAVTVAREAGCRAALRTPLGAITVGHLTAWPDEIVTVDGLRCTAPPLTVATLARCGVKDGVVAADACLHRGWISTEQLREQARRRVNRPGSRNIAIVAELSDGRAESPLETLTRLFLAKFGFVAEPQVWVYDDDGIAVARVDFLLDDGLTVVEADGLTKYRMPRSESDGDGDALVLEKLRQEAIENLGYVVARVTWRNVTIEQPQTAARLHLAKARAARMRGRPMPVTAEA